MRPGCASDVVRSRARTSPEAHTAACAATTGRTSTQRSRPSDRPSENGRLKPTMSHQEKTTTTGMTEPTHSVQGRSSTETAARADLHVMEYRIYMYSELDGRRDA